MRRASGYCTWSGEPPPNHGARGKRLGLLHELAPNAGVIAALINPNYQEADAQSRELQAAAQALRLQLRIASEERSRVGIRFRRSRARGGWRTDPDCRSVL